MVHPASLRCALALLVVVSLCAGCGSSDSSKVSTASYVSSVCSAIGPLERDVVARSNQLKNTTARNAAEAKQNLQGFLKAVEQDADRALARIKSAGIPDVSGGKTVSATIVRTFTQLRDALRTAVAKAATLPTDSPTAFQSSAQTLLASVGSALGQIGSSGLGNPEIEKEAARQPACKRLGS